ncbi:MAG TPA: TonB-dependent siderophore receptor [Caldimonas sp.]|jgi:iron complex outermembrane receptor protein
MAWTTTFAAERRAIARTAVTALLFSPFGPALAQDAALAPVTVTGKAPVPASVAGWGEVPLERAPVQAMTVDAEQMRDAGTRRLSDLTRFDPSVTSAYDAEGYIDYFTVRGFVIDNRFNFRRDGLPINAETSIPLENKARVDILKGLSGLQAGTSAPGGLVDLVVKRPLDAPLRSASLAWRERGSVAAAVDLSQRFGADHAFGVRLNVGAEHIDPLVRDARGNRNVVAFAADWRATPATLVEAEVEQSHRSQPSVPGFSLLGESMPAVPDPRLNLNNQPWSLPVVFDATTASLRLTQQLGERWRLVVHGLAQRLRTDDRIAFPFGCGSDSAGPGGTTYFDRFCANGNFDLYDFRSENERRHSSTLDVSLHGAATTAGFAHAISVGVQRTIVRNRFQQSAFNFAGTGNVDGTLVVPPAPELTTPNTDRDERSTELALRDAIDFGGGTTAWLGARTTQLARSATPTDGSAGTSFRQSFTTPFLALSQALGSGRLVYASWGRGVESDVAPNVPLDASATPPVPRYLNAGQALPAARSEQWEVGAKGATGRVEWAAAAFDIRRPLFGDIGTCGPLPCTRGLVGDQRHRGAEGSIGWNASTWGVRAGAQWLHARIENADDPSTDGKRPTNVPAFTARIQAELRPAAITGLHLLAAGSYESDREVLPDNSISIPSVTKFDLGARYEARLGSVGTWTLRAGIDNVFDRRAWRESPYQFAHAYLFPLEPRTLRVSLQLDL